LNNEQESPVFIFTNFFGVLGLGNNKLRAMENIFFDYIIIGSGLAGLHSAYYASRKGTVALISKKDLSTSCSYLAQGGIASAFGTDDSTSIHFEDTIRVGKGLCDESAVRILVNEGKEAIEELITMGMPFDKTDGKIELGLEGGHSRRRIIHSNGSSTGRAVIKFLYGKVKSDSSIKILPGHFVFELIVEDGICYGVKVFDESDKTCRAYFSNKVIIATGGASGIYERTTNPESSSGDGIALAYNAGAQIENMEFIQFHPTALSLYNAPTFLLSEAIRGEGGLIVDEGENRILAGKDKTELSPRDELSRIIFEYLESTGKKNAFLKLSHLDDKKIIERFSYIYEELKKVNLDLTKDLIPISPAAHYTVGGIKTGVNGETNITGLYAVGEAASSGVHGANRLASNSLLECLVFSRRAVMDSRNYLQKKVNITDTEISSLISGKNYGLEYKELRKRISSLMWTNAGIIRSGETLKTADETIGKIAEKYSEQVNDYNYIRIQNLLCVASLIIKGALLRNESRGCHIRKDYSLEERGQRSNILQCKSRAPIFQLIK
jgi:L-aspartate oxidase